MIIEGLKTILLGFEKVVFFICACIGMALPYIVVFGLVAYVLILIGFPIFEMLCDLFRMLKRKG